MDKNEKTINESRMDANSLLTAGAVAGAMGTAGALITRAVHSVSLIHRFSSALAYF